MSQPRIETEVTPKLEGVLGVSDEVIKKVPSSRVFVVVPLTQGASVVKSVASVNAIQNVISEIHGPVSLTRIMVKFIASKAGDGVGYVLTKTGSAVNEKNFLMKMNARKILATSYNLGELREFEVAVPAGLANQLSPVSGLFPGLEIFIKSYGQAEVHVTFELELQGDRFVEASDF
jgi:hypothetical protein